jgi:dihydrofolate reductase
MKKFSVVVAATHITRGIGRKGVIPWHLPRELKYFKDLTIGNTGSDRKNAVIMGRRSFESIPKTQRPLKDRINVILSSNPQLHTKLLLPSSVLVCSSLQNALEQLTSLQEQVNEIFIAGGVSVYMEAMKSSLCERIYLTSIHEEFVDIDTFFQVIDMDSFRLSSTQPPEFENQIKYEHLVFERL